MVRERAGLFQPLDNTSAKCLAVGHQSCRSRYCDIGLRIANAIVALSTLVGAMTLARIVTSSALSAEILESARNHLRL